MFPGDRFPRRGFPGPLRSAFAVFHDLDGLPLSALPGVFQPDTPMGFGLPWKSTVRLALHRAYPKVRATQRPLSLWPSHRRRGHRSVLAFVALPRTGTWGCRSDRGLFYSSGSALGQEMSLPTRPVLNRGDSGECGAGPGRSPASSVFTHDSELEISAQPFRRSEEPRCGRVLIPSRHRWHRTTASCCSFPEPESRERALECTRIGDEESLFCCQ